MRCCPSRYRPPIELVATFIWLIALSAFSHAARETLAVKAQMASDRGDFQEAATDWQRIHDGARGPGNLPLRVNAGIRLAEANFELGQIRQAREVAKATEGEAEHCDEPALRALAKSVLGAILSAAKTDDHNDAEKLLREAAMAATRANEAGTTARALNNLAVALAGDEKYEEAVPLFEKAAAQARKAGESALELESLSNAALTNGKALHLSAASRLGEEVLTKSATLPASHRHATAVLRAGAVFEMLDQRGADSPARLAALRAYQRAETLAAEIGDRASLAHALIGQGRLYEREHRWPEALALTRRGVFSAQGVRSPDLLFRGEWQAGRLLRELKDYPGAIAAMERARAELEVIRHDLALHYGHPNSGTSFREVTGGLFFDLADLLLRQADDATPESVPQLLTQARDAAEALKAAELEDYFQDECVNLLRQKTAKLESVATDAAILYIIPLPDRTETIITIGNKVQRVKSAATSREVEETATRMRRLLENRSTNEYLAPARQLYQWLITPLQKTLTEAGVTTLVFVPGGALRTIPMSALNDGSHFLIEQYAVAVAPGLTLLEPVPINRAPGAIILSGLSEARQNFPALPYVPAELSHLHDLYGGDELIDRDFVQRNVEQKFDAQPYQIVHIASHGHFDHDAAKTFLLTFDGKLTLNDLERLLQPARLRDQPVELLTLSACQTAAGDERAALGLAGVAVKAGARSALATLWFVNDEASASVVTDFYTQLHRSPKLNKAQALQTAQRHLLADPRYEHPCYWAPYLLIGNWL